MNLSEWKGSVCSCSALARVHICRYASNELVFMCVRPALSSADVNQLEQLFRNLGQEMSMDKVEEVMRKYDTDKSGKVRGGAPVCVFGSGVGLAP